MGQQSGATSGNDTGAGAGTGTAEVAGGTAGAGIETGTGLRGLSPQEQVESILQQASADHDADLHSFGAGQAPEKTMADIETARYKVKVDGQEVEVGLKELLAGYARQSDYTKKTQALAEQRRSLESQQKVLMESEAYKTLKALAEKEVGEFDPYDPDSVLAHMRKTAAEQIADMYKPVEEAYITETAKVKAQAFVSSKPEFKDDAFKKDVRDLLTQQAGLDLETAYWVVKGKRDTMVAETSKQEAARYRAAMAEAGLKISSGSAVESDMSPPPGVRKQGAQAIAAWFAAKKGSW